MSIQDNGSLNEPCRDILVPSFVCDSKLDPIAFRIYCHLANGDKKYPKNLKAIAFHLGLNRRTVSSALDDLIREGFVEKYSFEDKEAASLLSQKKPQQFQHGWLVCSWCKSQTLALEEHHYPVRRSLGGKEVVSICGSCHAEFHLLTDHILYRVIELPVSEMGGAEQ